jgi:hypothetical protein
MSFVNVLKYIVCKLRSELKLNFYLKGQSYEKECEIMKLNCSLGLNWGSQTVFKTTGTKATILQSEGLLM